jgi:ABC-type multidrug transport system fused ATPase/permease subunit
MLNLVQGIKRCLKLLTIREKRLLLLVLLVQLISGVLDLLGVILIGLIGSLTVSGLSSSSPTEPVATLLEFLDLTGKSIQFQVSALGTLAGILLITKTLVTMRLTKIVLRIMARRGASLSSSLVIKNFQADLTVVQSKNVHETIYSLTNGVLSITNGVLAQTINLASDSILLLVLGVGLYLIDPTIALSVIALFAFVAIALTRISSKKVLRLARAQTEMNLESSQIISKFQYSYREIYTKGRRTHLADHIGRIRFKLADVDAELSFLQGSSKYFFEIALVAGGLLVAAVQFMNNPATRAVATLGIFFVASLRIMPAILRVQQGWVKIRSNLSYSERTLSLIDELSKVEHQSRLQSKKLQSTGNLIEMREVNFSFGKDETNFRLSNLNLEVSKGQFVAIVGESGSGKSTLVDVIMGLRKPSSGTIRIEGFSPEEFFERFPGKIGYVPQECTIFEGSVRENIALGFDGEDIDDELCREVLKIANLDQLVNGFEDGIYHEVGDRGIKLSGGQRQRLGIARALYTNPEVIFLDEATSSLDALSEASITDSINAMKGRKTIVAIAHRLSTVRGADCIYYLERGKVIGVGSFENLVNEVPQFAAQVQRSRID